MADVAQHPRVRIVAEALASLGATASVTVLPDSARTAVEAASALGTEVGAIVNSLVFDTGDGCVLVLTSGAHRVDTAHLARGIGVAALGRATPELVRTHTGQAIGGVSPVGHPSPVPTYVDRWLARHETVWAAAGHPHAVFATGYDELLRLTGGTPVDVEPADPTT
ncbi:MAG: YbaK/EbsC family protein [Nocardioidaceae bacterium]|nr:YbaK/EbsC family protein [Nocardioidaceae bacterium]